MEAQTDGWMDGWMDGWIDGWMDKPKAICPLYFFKVGGILMSLDDYVACVLVQLMNSPQVKSG